MAGRRYRPSRVGPALPRGGPFPSGGHDGLGNDEWEIAGDPVYRGKDAAALREACGIDGDGDLLASELLEPLMQSWERGNSVCERAA